mgnify:CR=1 FL=1
MTAETEERLFWTGILTAIGLTLAGYIAVAVMILT